MASSRGATRRVVGRALAVASAFAVLLGVAPAALAGGLGGYLEGEFSWSEINDHGQDRGFSASMGGIGVLWDSDVSTNDPLNFRLQFGYRLGERELDEEKDEIVNGLTLDATVGYGVLRSPAMRVWAGPSLRLNYDWYSSVGDIDIVDLGIGIGPRFGVNLHMSETLSVTGSVAYHYMYLSELIEQDGHNRTIDGPQHMVGVRIGVLWLGEDDIFEE
ncbi:MAG: outer membrane beta-barrel protein [Myxococcota bacterium]|nr:outer membrane beta-barrel protein [Myxococcota bacterium]